MLSDLFPSLLCKVGLVLMSNQKKDIMREKYK